MPDILIRINGTEFRAPDEPTLTQWHAEGRVPDHALVWVPGAPEWVPASDLPFLKSEAAGPQLHSVAGEWHVNQAGTSYMAPDFATLKAWYREGRISDVALVYHPELGSWKHIGLVPGLGTPSSRVLLSVPSTYRGGAQGHPREMMGKAFVCENGFEFHTNGLHVDVPYERIIDVGLETFRPSGFRSIIGAGSSTGVMVQQVRNIVSITSIDPEGTERQLEFQIHGALTIMGEGEKAAAFRNRLLDFKSRFTRRGSGPATPLQQPQDAAARLKKLNELRESGLITDAEYEAKRAEVLNSM